MFTVIETQIMKALDDENEIEIVMKNGARHISSIDEVALTNGVIRLKIGNLIVIDAIAKINEIA